MYPHNGLASLEVVSQTFRELSKIISQKYSMPKSKFMVVISSWNCVRVPKALLWEHVQSISLKFSREVRFLQYTNSQRIFWRARETLMKHPPDSTVAPKPSVYPSLCIKHERSVTFASTTLLIIHVAALSEQMIVCLHTGIMVSSLTEISDLVIFKHIRCGSMTCEQNEKY